MPCAGVPHLGEGEGFAILGRHVLIPHQGAALAIERARGQVLVGLVMALLADAAEMVYYQKVLEGEP